MSVRLFHRGARCVFAVRRSATDGDLWCAVHRLAHDWAAILSEPLRLLGLTARQEVGQGLTFAGGEIRWTRGPVWTTIRVRLDSGSDRKRQLMKAALLRAARYGPG